MSFNHLFTLLMFLLSIAAAKVHIVTSTTDLADIAKTIGEDYVSVTSIARGNQNPHYVEVLPSYMIKVRRADLYLKIGMEMDVWSRQIIDGSRNRKLQVVDCSRGIERLEVPTTKIDASLGDIHRLGNPHYWLDPLNGKIIAQTIASALSAADPDHRSEFESNLADFQSRIDAALTEWQDEFTGLSGKKIIFYHNSWPYFARRFGLNVVQFVEPKPGIMPTPAHLDQLINIIERDEIKVIAMEPYFSDKAPKYLSQITGIQVIKLAQSVEALPEADSYLDIFRVNLKLLKSHLEPTP